MVKAPAVVCQVEAAAAVKLRRPEALMSSVSMVMVLPIVVVAE